MKRFTDSGRKALDGGNHYIALSLALMLPDICGSIEDPGPGKSQARYEAWYKKWLEPTYKTFLTAADCFQLRCSYLHSGSTDVEEKQVVDIESLKFFDDTMKGHCNYVGGNSINGVLQQTYLQLNAAQFCRDVFDAVDKWDSSVANDKTVQAEKKKLLFIHSAGATIGGVKFG
jgi:hypothetical protein